MEIDILLFGKTHVPLTQLVRKRIVDSYRGQTEASLRRSAVDEPRSALLFGPPGTSKTEVTRAIADDLQWPLVELTPSEFLKGNLANIYLQADEIFKDLADLSGVVVFFDETDALVQTREGENLDITSRFLTTTMLPKLARLHDRSRVVFFMATNYQEKFDAAIKRAGRFDLLICMWPPMLEEKFTRLHRAYDLSEPSAQTAKAGEYLREFVKDDPNAANILALLTFGEYRTLLKSIESAERIGDAIVALGQAGVRAKIQEHGNYATLKMAELEPLRDTAMKFKGIDELDNPEFTRQWLIERFGLEMSQTLRYFADRKESKEQH